MILSRIRKRVFDLSGMSVQIGCFRAIILVTRENPNNRLNPSEFLLKARFFRGDKLAVRPWAARSIQPCASPVSARLSRVVKNEAEEVLFDYLHCTRSLSTTDAEHISKNSPHFLQNLLLNIDTDKDVARSLTKFLRFHPINEFEPFFESLGISPSEFSAFLPRNLMFLNDDELLLKNFHVLCDYGIPRAKIGRIYKRAREIFGYDYGLLTSKLAAYERLGLSKSTVVKLVTCCPWFLIGGVQHEFTLVLKKLKGLGLEGNWIGRHLSEKGTYNWGRILDTLDFLHKVGYGEDQLGELLKSYPVLVFEGSGKRVSILFSRLLKLGIKINDICSLFMDNPDMLSEKYTKNLWQALDFLFDIGMEIEYIASIISTHMKLLASRSLKAPKTVCKNHNLTKDDLRSILKEEPTRLFSLASKSKGKRNELLDSQDAGKRREKTGFLLRLGYVENSDEMLKALKRFRGRGDQLQERFDCLVRAGLDFNVVANTVKQAPIVLNQSKDVIEKKIQFLTNYSGYPLESVVAFPAYLCYDMERIHQRFSMYLWLRERGAAKQGLSLSTILACSNARFVKYFVDVHPEGPAKWDGLRNSSIPSLKL